MNKRYNINYSLKIIVESSNNININQHSFKTMEDKIMEKLNNNINLNTEDVVMTAGGKESFNSNKHSINSNINTTTRTRNNNTTKEDVTTKDGRKESLNTTTNTTNNNITMEDVATKDGRKDSFLVIEEHIETKQMTTPSQDKNYRYIQRSIIIE